MAAAASVLLKLGGDDSAFQAAIGRAQARLQSFGKSVQAMGSKVSGWGKSLSVAAGVVGAPFAAAVMQFNALGDKYEKMATRTGIATEALSALAYAADMSGTSIDDIESSIIKMNKTLLKGSEESKSAVEALGRLGLQYEELEALSPEDKFKKICSSLNAVEDATLKNAIATSVFGGSGAKLIPLLKDMESLSEEAKALGVVMSTSQAKSAAAMNDAFGRVRFTIQSLMVSIGSALSPTITVFANKASSMISVITKWVSENQQLVLSVAKGVVIVGALGAGLIALGSAISIVGMGIAGLGTVLGVVASVASAVLSPIGLMIAGIAAGSYAFLTMTDAGQRLIDFFYGEFQNLYSIVKPVIDSIISAFSMGDFSTAAAIAFAAVKIPALQTFAYLKGLFNDFSYFVMSIWDGLTFDILKAWHFISSNVGFDFMKIDILNVAKFVQNTFLSMVQGVLSSFAWLINKTIGLLNTIGVISDATYAKAKAHVDSIPNAVKEMKENNNNSLDKMISDVNNSDDMRELRSIDDAKRQAFRDRAQANIDSNNESQQAIVNAQRELANLMRQQAEAAANYKPPAPTADTKNERTLTPIQRAMEIKPAEVTKSIKQQTDLPNSASFNTRIANALARGTQNHLAEKANELLEKIVENTADDDGLAPGEG